MSECAVDCHRNTQGQQTLIPRCAANIISDFDIITGQACDGTRFDV